MSHRLLVGVIGFAVVASGAGCGASHGQHAQSIGKTGPETPEEAPRLPPTTRQVEQGARRTSRREGRLRRVRCRELEGYRWSCTLRFVDGTTELRLAVWYGAQRTLGWSDVALKRTAGFKVH